MEEKLDSFIDQFYRKYAPSEIPQGDRRNRLKEKLRADFDGYVGQMYSKYDPDNLPDSTRVAKLKSKYFAGEPTFTQVNATVEEQPTQEEPNQWGAISTALKAVSPVAKTVYDFGRTIFSGLTDATPQTAAQAMEVVKTSLNPSNIEEYIKADKWVDFQRYVREKDPEYAGFLGFTKPFDQDKYIPIYGKQFMEDMGLGAEISHMEKNLPKVIERRKQLESYVQQQKNEAAQKLDGVVQDYRDIKDVSDFGSYISGMAGQATYQIPLSVASRGGSSYLMELATVYDKNLDNQAQKYGISREEVIDKNLDRPAEGISYAMAAAGLDAASAGNLVGAFRRQGGSLLKQYVTKAAPVMNAVGEGLTEATQGVLEEKGAGGTVSGALSGKALGDRTNEFLGGLIGGGIFAFNGKQKEKQIADRVINEVANTGNPGVNSFVDGQAALSPAQEELLKTKKAEQSLKEVSLQEEKLLKKVGKEPVVDPVIEETLVKDELNLPVVKRKTDQRDVNHPLANPIQLEEETITTQEPEQEQIDSVFGKYNQKQGSTTQPENVDVTATSEYQTAVEKVASLQNKFGTLSVEENTDELYKELQDAKAALRKISPPVTQSSANKSAIQKTIEDNTGVIRPVKSIKMTPNEAIKHQVQTFYRGMARGVRKGKGETDQLITKVQEAVKNSPLQPRQISSILNKIKSTNLSTPGSIGNLNRFIDKVSEDADYSDKLSKAQQSVKQIRSKVNDNLSFREKQAVKTFLKIKPQEVSDIQQYTDLAESIKEGLKPLNSKKVKLNLEAINSGVQKLISKTFADEFQAEPASTLTPDQMLESIGTRRLERTGGYAIAKLADDLDISFEEAETLFNAEDSQTIEDSKRHRFREGLINRVKEVELVQQNDFNADQKKMVEQLNTIDPELLSDKQLREYLRVADRISENGDFGGAGNLAVVSKTQKDFKTLQEKLKNSKILNLNVFEEYVSASTPQAIEAIYGLPKEAAMFQLYTGIKGVSDAKAYAIKEAEQFVESVNELHDKFTKLYGRDRNGFSDESIFRQGIYSELLRVAEDTDPQEAFAKNKEAIQATIGQYKDVGEVKDSERLENLYKPFVNSTSMDDAAIIMQKIDPAGKRVFEHIVKYYDKFLPEIANYNELYFNKPTEKIFNYAGSRKWKKKGSANNIFDIDGVEDVVNLGNHYHVAKPKQASSAKEYTNTIRENAVLELNLHKKASDQIQDMVFRMKALPHMLQVREFKSQKDVLKLFGWNGNDPELKKKANDLYDKIFNERTGIYFTFEKDSVNNGSDVSRFEKGISAVLNTLRKVGYTLTLSGLTQAPKQATVLANVGIQLGKDSGLIASSISEAIHQSNEFKDFMKGETVSIRGEQKSLFNLGDFYNASSALEFNSSVKKFFTRSIPKWTESRFDGWMGIKPLTKTDVSVAQASFLAFYKKYLKDNNVEFEGLTKETKLRDDKVRQEARAFAKQRVDTLQVVSNPAELSKFMKDKNVFAQIARTFFVPYGTFSTNSKQRLWSDYRALLTGNVSQKKAAAKDIAATFTEQAVYNVVHQGVKLALVLATKEAIQAGFDLPEDPEQWDKWWRNTKKAITKDMTFSTLPIIVGSPGEDMAVDYINEGIYALHKLDNPDLTLKQYEKDFAPIGRYKNYDSNFWDHLGPAGVPVVRSSQAFELWNKSEDGELTEDQRNLALLASLTIWAQMAGAIPADFVNPIISESNKKLQKQKGGFVPSRRLPTTRISPPPTINN